MFFLDPVILTFYRFLLGLLTMIVFAYHKNMLSDIKKISYSDFKILSFLGIINIALAMSSLQLAVKYSNAATAAVIFCSNPFFVFIFSILSGNEKFNFKCFSGVVLGIAGVAMVMSRHGFHISHGALFAVMASMLFAFYIIVNKKV
ncbi:MAG TPA: DMT family transporter, partial [Candidatus Wallbacteria bacterium]|nr:DMT family transporter [Candidatus Wallbacteria bacterium]